LAPAIGDVSALLVVVAVLAGRTSGAEL